MGRKINSQAYIRAELIETLDDLGVVINVWLLAKKAFGFLLCTSRVHVIDKEGLSTLRISKLDRRTKLSFHFISLI